MKKLLVLLLVAISVVMAGCSKTKDNKHKALVVGETELRKELVHYLERYGAEVVQAESHDLSDGSLDEFDILCLCAGMNDTPRKISKEQAASLLSYIEKGGKVFAEYAVLPDEVFAGWHFPEKPILNRFESVAVAVDNPAMSGLQKDDLLEEHNAYLLDVKAPDDARTLLDFGIYFGTYKVEREYVDQPCSLTMVVDLGQVTAINKIKQWFGGLDSNYLPDEVSFSVSDDDNEYKEVAKLVQKNLVDYQATVEFDSTNARFVKVYVTKEKKSPVTDFLVINNIEIYDENGENVSLSKPYTIQYNDGETKNYVNAALTNGQKAKPWQDDREYLFSVTERLGINEKKWNALIEWEHGQGSFYYATTSLSTFRKNNYRLTERWEQLLQGLTLILFPADERNELAKKILPLKAYTKPGVWGLPDEEVKLYVQTSDGAKIDVSCDDLDFSAFENQGNGLNVCSFVPSKGEYKISIAVSDEHGKTESTVNYSAQPRDVAYRRALDRNMQWFLNSDVMPKEDGSGGIKSTLEIGALYAGKAEDLDCPFRTDCQAMSAKAFYLYGDLTNDDAWHNRAVNLADFTLSAQYTDPTQKCFGGWRWLLEGNAGIYPQDDNNRISEFMAWLYTRTANAEYLKAALRNVEMINDTAREDNTLTYWVTSEDYLNEKGRRYLRTSHAMSNFTDWCLYRYDYAFKATGQEYYKNALDKLIRIYGQLALRNDLLVKLPNGGGFINLDERGIGIAVNYLQQNDELRAKLIEKYESRVRNYFSRPDVIKYGSHVKPADIGDEDRDRAFVNDCTTHTKKGEPLSDQLYDIPKKALMSYEVSKAMPESEVAKMAVEKHLDYLVRIQMSNPDSRLDGCWLRSFDMENREYYGTRYDPNYGAYCAYTGWMNSLASQALAYYLLDENPFDVDEKTQKNGEAIRQEVLEERIPEYLKENNYLSARSFESDILPELGSKTLATITDGVIEGVYTDNLSAGWIVGKGKGDFEVELDLVLDSTVKCDYLSIRHGGFNVDYFADSLELWAAENESDLKMVFNTSIEKKDGSNWYKIDESLRALKIVVKKKRQSDKDSRLYIGEIQLIGKGK